MQQVRSGEFPAALAALLGDWNGSQVPRLACGMIGSRQGWREAQYSAFWAILPKFVAIPSAALPIAILGSIERDLLL